jgi:NADH-quinone oxidoreductase subunit M
MNTQMNLAVDHSAVYTLTETPWDTQVVFPVLGVLQLLPLLMAVLILLLRKKENLVKLISIIAVTAEMLLAILLYHGFDSQLEGMQFAEHLALLPGYHAAIDGVSMLFILLTAFISAMLVLYSLARKIQEMPKLLPTILVTEAVVMILFSTMNLLWFVLFSGIELILVAYMLLHWASSPEKDLARARYIQFMLVGICLLVAGVLMLGWNYSDITGGKWDFDLFDLVKVPIPDSLQTIIFFLLFYGFAIRTPIFPMHGWLPIFTTHGNVALAPAVMLGLKLGIYGMLRFVFTLTPDAIIRWQPYIIAFAVAGVFYAAILAFMQKNLRRLLAFAVISHTSILVIGLFSLGHTAFQGSVMLSVNFGLAIVTLVFMTGFVFRRSKSLLLSRLGGLFDTIPLIGATFLIAGLAIVGMPGTPGFDSVHLILEAAMERFGALITVVAALGNVIAAGFLLWAFQRAFLTPRESPATATYLEKTNWMERAVAIILLLVLITTGFHSDPWLNLIETPLEGLHALYSR